MADILIVSNPPRECECGCGQQAPVAKKGHFARTPAASPPPVMRGEANPRWKGDQAGYFALHVWIRSNCPMAGRCEECGAAGATELALRDHMADYTRNREDYRELCGPCHKQYDRPWEAVSRDPATGQFVPGSNRTEPPLRGRGR